MPHPRGKIHMGPRGCVRFLQFQFVGLRLHQWPERSDEQVLAENPIDGRSDARSIEQQQAGRHNLANCIFVPQTLRLCRDQRLNACAIKLKFVHETRTGPHEEFAPTLAERWVFHCGLVGIRLRSADKRKCSRTAQRGRLFGIEPGSRCRVLRHRGRHSSQEGKRKQSGFVHGLRGSGASMNRKQLAPARLLPYALSQRRFVSDENRP